jgi:hypothetical protein
MSVAFTYPTQAASPAVDFDLHGFLAIRLLDASPRDVVAVERQLGLRASPVADRDAAVIVRFVSRLADRPRTRLLGLGEAAYTRDHFFILRGAEKARVRCAIDFREIGDVCEIVCESGIGSVPLLVPIINLSALARGFVPLHGSAFEYEGEGIVVAGWAKGGKTELLLAFMSHGAHYVGDEWVYLSPDGDAVYGLPEPIKLWDWHLDDLPDVEARLTPAQRWKLRSAVAAETLAGLSAGSVGRRAAALIGRQRYVNVSPEKLFGVARRKARGRFDHLFFAGSHESAAVRVEAVEPEDVARRMAFSLTYERLDFLSWYLKYRFAFPDRANAFIDGAMELERALLSKALKGKPAHGVYHPYPARIPDLYRAVRPLLNGDTAALGLSSH